MPFPMPFIVTKSEIKRIRLYLLNDLEWKVNMSMSQRKTFAKKAKSCILFEDKVFYSNEEVVKRIVADDDNEQLNVIFRELHLPDHTGMKAMYENSKLQFTGFKRENLYRFVSSCLECK